MSAEENLNAARPVQVGAHSPESGVSDEAVEAAARALHPTLWDGLPGNRHAESARADARLRVRAVLAAALPHLQPQPVASRERVAIEEGSLRGLYDDTRTLAIRGSINHEVAIKLGAEETFFTWADDLLTAATQAAIEANSLPSVHPQHHDHINARDAADCDACNSPPSRESTKPLMGAAPVAQPTREQIEQALQECGIGSYRTIVADALLDLLNGTGVDSSLNTCPGCGVNVIGHERCGDPTRPGCAS